MKRIILMIMILGISKVVFAAQPIETLKKPVEESIALLQNPAYKAPDQKEAQREKIWEIVQTIFDFNEITKRSVAMGWTRFSPEQQKEFTQVFSELLKNNYIDKIQGGYNNETVEFIGQSMMTANKAVVRTKIKREQIKIPVDYSMYQRNGEWKVYDVQVEGVSLTKNYREQIRSILLKDTPDALIQRIKEKNEQHRKQRTSK